MHMIVIRKDLGTFAHVHPEPTGERGRFRVGFRVPTTGQYAVHVEFRRQGQMTDVLTDETLRVPGPAPAPAPVPDTEVRSVTAHGITAVLTGRARAGESSDLHFRFTDASTGRPVDDLRPYLGAAGHVAIVKADGSTFAHEHAETVDDHGRPVFALPGTTFGPTLDLHADLATPGAYRFWAQFRAADGTVLTLPFTVVARAGGTR
jgi:Cu+-exporting ATPase